MLNCKTSKFIFFLVILPNDKLYRQISSTEKKYKKSNDTVYNHWVDFLSIQIQIVGENLGSSKNRNQKPVLKDIIYFLSNLHTDKELNDFNTMYL